MTYLQSEKSATKFLMLLVDPRASVSESFDLDLSQGAFPIDTIIPDGHAPIAQIELGKSFGEYFRSAEQRLNPTASWKASNISVTAGSHDFDLYKEAFRELAMDKQIMKKRASLLESYDREKRRYIHYLSDVNRDIIDKLFKDVIAMIVNIEYEKVAFELTQDQALFIIVKLKSEMKVHLKLRLNRDDEGNFTSFLGIYSGYNCLISETGPTSSILKKIRDELIVPAGTAS